VATIDSLMKRTVKVSECLEFTGHICEAGYGLVWHGGKNRLAHRVSFELHNAPIMNEQHVMHSCDNRKCINPLHLELGSRVDNMQDMLAKGRANRAHGQRHGMSKITAEIAAEIRRRYVPHGKENSSSAMAREFGVTQAAVSAVIRGITWKDA
jgi:hypothetical protein